MGVGILEISVKNENVIIGGDLKFTLGAHEIWGSRTRTNQLADYFAKKLREGGLTNVGIIKLKRTWSNTRVGDNRNSKRLDHFLVIENLVEHNKLFKQWINSSGDSGHLPIFLELQGDHEILLVLSSFVRPG